MFRYTQLQRFYRMYTRLSAYYRLFIYYFQNFSRFDGGTQILRKAVQANCKNSLAIMMMKIRLAVIFLGIYVIYTI